MNDLMMRADRKLQKGVEIQDVDKRREIFSSAVTDISNSIIQAISPINRRTAVIISALLLTYAEDIMKTLDDEQKEMVEMLKSSFSVDPTEEM